MYCTAVYNFLFSNICTFWNIVNLMIPNRVGIGHPFNHPEFRGSSTRRFDEILSCCCCSSQRRIFGILGICSPHSKEFFFLSNHNTHFTVSINLTRKKVFKIICKISSWFEAVNFKRKHIQFWEFGSHISLIFFFCQITIPQYFALIN